MALDLIQKRLLREVAGLHEMPESRKSKPRSIKSYDFQDCHIDAMPSIWQFFVITKIRGHYVYRKDNRTWRSKDI